VNAAEPADSVPSPIAALDELVAPPLLKARDENTEQVSGLFQPSSNTMTKAVRRASEESGREIAYDMPIDYRDGHIYNPATGKHDAIHLRSYNHQFVAPTVVMKPGQTVRFNLKNDLPAEGANCAKANMNDPSPNGCFNVTNLHSHGLWVSPMGNSDNVLLSISPGVAFEYEYNVPVDHPAGTFWYHPHQHGSTAIQVGSGMAGALVVEGNRKPTTDSNGDVDTLLKPLMPVKDGKQIGAQEEVKLFQQIPYACFDSHGNIKVNAKGQWICDDGDVGVVENFDAQVGSPTAWGLSGRYTLINGQARPGISLRTGQVYRWRLINAGFNETINLRIRKVVSQKYLSNTAIAPNEVKHACTGTDVTQFEIASDGLTHSKIISKINNILQPGYRSDILFSLPEKGIYCVYDDSTASNASVNASAENAKVLAIIVAKGDDKVSDQQAFLQKQLVEAATTQFEGTVRDQVIADLKNGLQLAKFIPHQTITDKEIADSKQNPVYIEFNLVIPTAATPNVPVQFLINNSAYKSGRIDQTLILGTAQTWFLSSKSVNHPFHIHVNPFQIVSITDKATGKPTTDPQYQNMVGTWKDTLFVTTGVNIETRTRYERYIGEYVLHCHILEHEDQGMMQNVEVVLPDGNGGAMKKGHH
jgi:FtsP/CotA-like multicopper oxidase with cupredoxin domain